MSTALPFRFAGCNSAASIAAPAALSLIATRQLGADRPEVVLRADLDDLSPPAARRHALQVLDAMAARFPGEAVDVQLLDASNVPQMICTGGVQ